MVLKIERVTEGCVLGEGPHWDSQNQVLYFVDILGKSLLKYNPSTSKVSKVSVAPNEPSIIIPLAGKTDQFLITLNNELVVITWDGESDTFTKNETLYSEPNGNKFNDGKCDASGRLWTGTYGTPPEDITTIPPVGTLYSLNAQRQLIPHVGEIRASNGLAFNDKTQKMYYIDTLKGAVDRFDLDVVEGKVSERKVWFTLKEHNVPGFPDGMTIDTDGNLWVAVFEGSRIIKVDGSKPETLLDTIEMPARQVTSLAFGGPNLDELYATTGTFAFGGDKPEPPVNGATYRITGLGVKGAPAVRFKLN
ncbi:regucalcin-like [Zophobas morio]|uniref:regucalcin-like n=1 Tax=Zophobas morio TaxID=2755281 RepID=UPI0030839DEC